MKNIFSYISYGNLVWLFTYDNNPDILEKLQRKCMRIINFKSFQAHTNPLFKNLKILKLKDVFQLELLKFVFDYKNKNLPHILNMLFKETGMTHSHNTRGVTNKNLYIPAFNSTHFGQWTLKYQCPYRADGRNFQLGGAKCLKKGTLV